MAIFNSYFKKKTEGIPLKNKSAENIPHLGVSENVVYPIVPNGFADQTIPF